MSEDDEIIFSELSDEDLVLQMHDDLYDGLKEEIIDGTEILLERGWSAEQVLAEALVAGMTIVGIDFRDGILFVPEVLLSANAMKGGMAILKPLLAEKDFSLRKINIASEPVLQKKLALRIPVLRLPAGAEHNWPFNWSRLENELDKDQS